MPPDITFLDAIAFAWFLAAWVGYIALTDWYAHRFPGINKNMALVRRVWMVRLMERDNRIFDSQLVGHTINSVTFFASTSVLVIAGLISLFGTVDSAVAMLGESGIAVATSKAMFELKLLVLLVIFIYGFLKFTWALRQYNYTCGLLGAAPHPEAPEAERRAVAEELAGALTGGISAFNAGLRAYYFALAALTWFIQPWMFIAATTWVVTVLAARQLRSPFATRLARIAAILEKQEASRP